MRITVRSVIKTIFLLALLGATVWGVMALNQAANTAEVKVEKWTADAHTEAESRWEKAAENENLILYFDPAEGQVMVIDRANAAAWRSNPEDAAKDSVAFGQNKSLVRSLLDVTYVDSQSASYTVNSYMGSVKDGTYRYEFADDGVYVTFQFDKQEFEIPCFFGIREDRFVAKVLGSEIREHGALKISEVVLLPFFGSGSRQEDGYLVVPDGSGAIIRFNNQKQTYVNYAQRVYGRNLTQNMQTYSQVTRNAMMPVFGIRKESGSMVAVIVEGDAQAEIRASVAPKITSNNNVYSAVSFIQSENNTLLSGSDNEEVSIMLSKQCRDFTYEVDYFLLPKGTGYADMAARYRRYLTEEAGMVSGDSTEQAAVNLDFIGGMRTRKTFLGVPYQAVECLTGFADVQRIAVELQQKTGLNFQAVLEDSLTGGSMSKMPTDISYASSLGGKSGYAQMAKGLAEAGIPFYPMYDVVTLKRSGNGYSSLDAARNVSRSAARQYDYLLSSGARDTQKSAVYLLSPENGAEAASRLADSAEKNGVKALGVSGLSSKMYGDYRKDTVPPVETKKYWTDALAELDGKTDSLLLDAANAYCFPYASAIVNVPVYCSEYDVEDESIPFYQLVMSGTAALYGEPMNENGNLRYALLRSVEYGVSPSFRLMAAGSAALQDTDYQYYFSISYEDWAEEIEAMAQELSGAVLGQRMVGHEKCADGVYATTFADGSRVYVNYSGEEVTVDGVTVGAMDFARKEA